MKASIKIFAYSVVIPILLLACVETDPNDEQATSPSSNVQSSSSDEERPVMDSRAKFYSQGTYMNSGELPIGYVAGDKAGYLLGYFGSTAINIITDKNILMWGFHISDSEQAECNYFAIHFSAPSVLLNHWILSQDMVLHNITPANLRGCIAATVPSADAILVCDDTAEGNLKDKIDIDSIRSYADPSWNCN